MYFYNKIDFLKYFSDFLSPFNDLINDFCFEYNVDGALLVYSRSLITFVFLK
jgi:hypothetical protein